MKVDFYILDNVEKPAALFFLCQLIEKKYADLSPIYIHVETQTDAEYLDDLLWTFRDDSFLAHRIYHETDDLSPPIQIGHGENPPPHQMTLINLQQHVPPFYRQFKQVIEIVFSGPFVQQSRERYKQYRHDGCELNTYKEKLADHDLYR